MECRAYGTAQWLIDNGFIEVPLATFSPVKTIFDLFGNKNITIQKCIFVKSKYLLL